MARSAGTNRSAKRPVTGADVLWADLIFGMEEKHKTRILAEFRREADGAVIHVLDIPDHYRFMEPELVDLIEAATKHLVEAAQSGN